MDKRLDNGNWQEVFGESARYGPAENAMRVETFPGDSVSTATFKRADVAEIVHIHDESPEGYGSWTGVAVVRLKDGRYAAVSGWADTSGWG